MNSLESGQCRTITFQRGRYQTLGAVTFWPWDKCVRLTQASNLWPWVLEVEVNAVPPVDAAQILLIVPGWLAGRVG